MRIFPFITVGQILEEIWEKYRERLPEERVWRIDKTGEKVKRYPITRATFYRKEEELDFPGRPTSGETLKDKKWRKYSREEADAIIKMLEEDNKFFGTSTK